jgi:FMN phosphatase YigB (HAD superfamily)
VCPLILIDLDETLVDRDAVLRQWALETTDAEGRPDLADWLIAHDRHEGRVRDRASFLGGVAAKFGWDAPVEQLLIEWPMTFGSRYRLDDATADALRRARDSGFRVAVVSNGDGPRQRSKISAMGLDAFVDACVVSGEVGVRKPDRRIFEIAAERAGADLDGQSWVIGDDPVADIGGGLQIGAEIIWVNRGGKHWPDGVAEPHASFDEPVAAIDYVLDRASC